MGCLCTKSSHENQKARTSQSLTKTAAQPVSEVDVKLEDGGEIFLPYPDTPGKYVDFDARLENGGGRYFLKNVRESGLAFSAGFRSDDVLISVNGENIDGKSAEYLLNLFRNLGQPRLLLGVERSPGDEIAEFIWTIFEVIITDGVPNITVIQTVKNDKDEMPEFTIDESFTWEGPPADPYDIYINPQLYLSIVDDALVFTTYSPNSQFHRYNYSGRTKPSKGGIVAYSLHSLGMPPSTAQNTPAGTATNTLEVLDFPKSMYTPDVPIPANARFWLEATYEQGFSLESLQARGWYLGVGQDNQAILSNEPTALNINPTDVKPE